MPCIQASIREKLISPARIFNADETGIYWAPELQHQYIPTEARRAGAPNGDESGRFTALLGGSASGDMLPIFLIVKCSCKTAYDLSSSTILNKFFGEDKLCKPSDGWTRGLWERKMVSDKKEVIIKKPYLLNMNTLDLISVQSKAWNDTVGCLMWIGLQLKLFKVCSSIYFLFDRVIDSSLSQRFSSFGR